MIRKVYLIPKIPKVPFDVINLYNRFSGINKIVNVIGAIPEGEKIDISLFTEKKLVNEQLQSKKERSKDRQTPDKQFDEIFVSEKHKDFVCKMMIDLQIIDNDFNYIGRGKPSNRTLISSLIEVCKKECFFSSDLKHTELGRIFCKKMKLDVKRLTKSTGIEEKQIRNYLSKNIE